MVKPYLAQPEAFLCRIRNQFHLMTRHLFMRFVIDSFNLAVVLQLSDHTPEIDDCARGKIDILPRRGQNVFRQQNFGNGVCHEFESPVTFYFLRCCNKGDPK